MKVLLISADPRVREWTGLALRSATRRTGEAMETLEASGGLAGMALAWKERPDLVVADEIASGAGAFAVSMDLKGADPPFPGKVIVLLDRSQDEWLARWSGADAWFVKPINPFELAEAVEGILVGSREEAV